MPGNTDKGVDYMTATIDDIIRVTAFTYDKKVKAYKQKRNRITAGQIDIMIALALLNDGMDDPKEVVFI